MHRLKTTDFSVIWGEWLSPCYLENLRQNQTTSKSIEVYVIMMIHSATGSFIKCWCDPAVQPWPEKIKTEVAGWQVIAAVSATNKKGQSHHTSTAFPPEESVHRERTGRNAFSLLRLFTPQPASQESNQVVALPSNYKDKEEIECFFSMEMFFYCSLDMLFLSSLVELLWVNTCLSTRLRKLFRCKSHVRGYRELGIKCIPTSQDRSVHFYMLLCELPSLL